MRVIEAGVQLADPGSESSSAVLMMAANSLCHAADRKQHEQRVDFLHRNHRLLDDNGEAIVNDVGLAALTLLIAESDPAAKDVMTRLVMNMLARDE